MMVQVTQLLPSMRELLLKFEAPSSKLAGPQIFGTFGTETVDGRSMSLCPSAIKINKEMNKYFYMWNYLMILCCE